MSQLKESCTNYSPPWFVGHWRDWHRGHGCDQDDGKPRSEAASAEVAQREAIERDGSSFLSDAELRFLRARTTAGDTLLVRALDELAVRRAPESARQSFDHSKLVTRHFEPLLGYCVCIHCTKLPLQASNNEDPRC